MPEPLPIVPGSSAAGVRSPKTSELISRTLRQMIIDGQLKEMISFSTKPS